MKTAAYPRAEAAVIYTVSGTGVQYQILGKE